MAPEPRLTPRQRQVLDCCVEAVRMRPEYPFARALLCASLVQAGMEKEAQQQWSLLRRAHPDFRAATLHDAIPRGRHYVADLVVESLLAAGADADASTH